MDTRIPLEVLPDSTATPGSYGPSEDASPSHGASFEVPYLTVDAKGRVTQAFTKTITLPASGNTDTKVNVTLGNTTKAYLLGTSTTPTAAAKAVESIADTGVYLSTTSGELVATTFKGNLDGTAAKATADASGSNISETYATKTENAGKASADHVHGNITNDGKLSNTTSGKPLITGTNGVILAGSFGTSAGTFVEGNDSRLSDSRTPVAHAASTTTYGAASSTMYGHAKASTTTPLAAGTASVGTDDGTYARGDHVHPAQTSISGNAETATKLQTKRTIDGVEFDGSAAISHYGSCTTAASTAEKAVSVTSYKLATGSWVAVKFTTTNTASNPTLNVNSTGTKAIYYRGSAITAGYLAANRTYLFVYNGSQYELVGDLDTNTDNDVKVNVTLGTTTKAYLLGTSTTPTSSAQAVTSVADTGVYLDTAAGRLTAGSFAGDGQNITLNTASSLVVTDSNNKLTTTSTLPADAVPNIDASKITSGTIDIERLPAGALERLVVRENLAAIYSLTSADVQVGDTVKDQETGRMYYVKDIDNLDSADGYEEYSVGSAASVPWTGVTNKPNSYTPASHASSATTYGISTDTLYGHAMATTTTPKAPAATAVLGTETAKFARGDHQHPLQTTISGNAGSATEFSAAQAVTLTGDVTGTASSKAGWSVATTLANSGVTAGTIGDTTQQTPSHGGTFNIPYVTVDAKGRVTAGGTTTVKLPTDQNTDTKVTQTVTETSDSNKYPILTKNTNAVATITDSSRFVSGVTIQPSTGTIEATKFKGNLEGNVTGNITGDITGDVSGNASTATEFSSTKSVTLTGDVTGTASSKAGWSVATTLANSGVTAGTYGNTSQQTPSHGETFNIPYVTVDAKGRVTAGGTTTVKLPTDQNTDTKVTQTVTTTSDTNKYPILIKNTNETSTITDSSRFVSGITVQPSTGTIEATKFKGNLEGNVTGNITGDITGDVTGNASTATQFASNQSVTLTGDVTGTASSKAGWSIATTLANSGVTANTYGSTTQQTPDHGATFNVPYVTVDAKGRVTAAGTSTVKLPTDSDTNTKVTQTVTTTSGEYPILAKNTTATDTITDTSRFASAVTLNPSTGTITATKFKGGIEGNADTATQFASNQSVTLTGDVTGTASSKAGWSVATTLANSGVTAGTYGNTSQQTPSYGGTFNIPYVTVDAKGRVTAGGTTTVKLPADDSTDTKVNVKLDTTTKSYLLATTTTPTSSDQAVTAVSDTGVYLDTTAGKLTATSFAGNGASLTNLNGSNIASGTVAAARIANLDASKITSGTIDIARLPAGALERLKIVENETERLALTTNDVQKGDTVKQNDTGVMYLVVDDTKLNLAAGYTEYTAGSATSVPWSGVTSKPSSFTPAAHASTATTYGVSSASNYGHAMASSTTPIVAGTAAVGSETAKFARGDHVHPAQTSVSGNAGTATKLATARTIDGVDFDGSAAISHYASCSTAAATAAKAVSLTGYKLVTGSLVAVKFTVANTAANPTLNVNSTGAKAIYYMGAAITAGYLAANRTYLFVYNGTQYELVGDINTDPAVSAITNAEIDEIVAS